MDNNTELFRAQKPWDEDEIEYLCENWGNRSVNSIASHLGRTSGAIIEKSRKLGLGAFFQNSYKYVTKHELYVSLGLGNSGGYKDISWIKNRGLKVHKIVRKKASFEVIYLDEFWKWAYKNKVFLDFSRFEKYALGPEPEWVDRKRSDDIFIKSRINYTPWTISEDRYLKRLLAEHKYTYLELSKLLHRTDGAIQKRIIDLNIKERPIKADNRINWTDEKFEVLADMIKAGNKYEQISFKIGKSAKAIRGKVYSMYYTENLDKVRSYIGSGGWGDGKPDAKLRLIRIMPEDEKNYAKALLSEFAFAMREHAKNKSGVSETFRDFWQKDVCANWDDILGCTAGESNCDSCTSFQRIQVQYCKRCGKDFYERKPNDLCKDCRQARLHQAKKKYSIMQAKRSK